MEQRTFGEEEKKAEGWEQGGIPGLGGRVQQGPAEGMPKVDRPPGWVIWPHLSFRGKVAGGWKSPLICGPVVGRMESVALTLCQDPGLAEETRAEAIGVEGRGGSRMGLQGGGEAPGDGFFFFF